jgi:hypothetical protein
MKQTDQLGNFTENARFIDRKRTIFYKNQKKHGLSQKTNGLLTENARFLTENAQFITELTVLVISIGH